MTIHWILPARLQALRSSFWLRSVPLFPFLLLALFAAAPAAGAQDWFRTGTGLGVEKARVAVADFAPRVPSAQPLANTFSEVVRADLEYSGILEVVSKSFYPLEARSVPA